MSVGATQVDLAGCAESLAAHLGAALRRYGAAALSVVDLPALSSGSRVDPAQIELCATLLWTREVEEAGLPAFVEALAEGVVKGTLLLPLTTGADRLAEYYRDRQSRFAAGERNALYAQLFGDENDEADAAFFSLFRQLALELGGIGDAGIGDGVGRFQARAVVLAQEIAAHLVERSGGILAFAARDIVAHIRTALALLDAPEISRVFGVSGPWTIVRVHAPEVLGRSVDPDPHLYRARAGYRMLSWVARVGNVEGATGGQPGPADAVVQAAQSWRAVGGA
jgi:hypothetical protein